MAMNSLNHNVDWKHADRSALHSSLMHQMMPWSVSSGAVATPSTIPTGVGFIR
jgi:hypothetical protein